MDFAGTQLFVVHYDGLVMVINTRDYTAQTLWDGRASDVVTSRDGRHLYVAHKQAAGDGANGVVSMLDIACATTVATVPVNDVAALAISPDGSRLYAISYDQGAHYHYPAGWLTIINTASHAVVETIAVGACPETVTVSPACTSLTTISPDGKRAYVTNLSAHTLSVVDSITNSVATIVDVPRYPEVVQSVPTGTVSICGDCWSGVVAVISIPTVWDPHIDAAS
jgi:YVTN family beta-propeller protein